MLTMRRFLRQLHYRTQRRSRRQFDVADDTSDTSSCSSFSSFGQDLSDEELGEGDAQVQRTLQAYRMWLLDGSVVTVRDAENAAVSARVSEPETEPVAEEGQELVLSPADDQLENKLPILVPGIDGGYEHQDDLSEGTEFEACYDCLVQENLLYFGLVLGDEKQKRAGASCPGCVAKREDSCKFSASLPPPLKPKSSALYSRIRNRQGCFYKANYCCGERSARDAVCSSLEDGCG